MSASPERGGKCRARRGDRGMLVYTGQNRFFSVLLTLAPSEGFFMCVISIFFGFTHKIKSMELFSAPCFFVALIFC